jgi:hypothetical protein
MLGFPIHRAHRGASAPTGRLTAWAVAVETLYALAVAAAAPHGSFAVGVVIALACPLAMLIQARID